eukprot:scaffold35843_cov1532-Skeletonema_dohrnii-CCMP3373.AAC.3
MTMVERTMSVVQRERLQKVQCWRGGGDVLLEGDGALFVHHNTICRGDGSLKLSWPPSPASCVAEDHDLIRVARSAVASKSKR